jgi:hypothetical protein
MSKLPYDVVAAEYDKPVPAPKLLLAGTLFVAASFGSHSTLVAHPGLTTATRPPQEIAISTGDIIFSESEPQSTLDRIHAIAANADLRDDDEPAPVPEVLHQANSLINEASILMETPMPSGTPSTFWGELNITWRVGEKIVRLACFANRPAILQQGDLSLPLGSYSSQPDPTGKMLALVLDALATDDA